MAARPLGLLVLLGACTAEDPAPRDGFVRDTDVRITAPANGAAVESPFTVVFEAGRDVASVRLASSLRDPDGTLVPATPVQDGGGEFALTLEPGGWNLFLVGEDTTGEVLSSHRISIRVTPPEEPWVTITSPGDGAIVPAPVLLVVDAAPEVDAVELSVDGVALGRATTAGLLEWAADPGTWTVEARGLQDGAAVATARATVTVVAGTSPEASAYNDHVLELAGAYPMDGTHDYWWPSEGAWAGTTRDVWYLETLVAEGDPEGRCYCVGITWEVFMAAFDAVDALTGGDGTLNGMTVADLLEFRTDWYVRELLGAGVVDAVEAWGLGERVTDPRDLRLGDFVQFWRNSASGHSVVFLDLVEEEGQVAGLRYWSCQGSTDGIGEVEERFGSGASDLDPALFFGARVRMPDRWSPLG